MPLLPQSNRPYIKGYPKYRDELPSQEDLDLWATRPDDNVAIMLGAASGLVALDLDHNVAGLHDKILQICGKSPLVKFGSKGCTLFFKYTGQKTVVWKRQGLVVAELLTQQTTIPPSIHHSTLKPYVWLSEGNLHTVNKEDVPELPRNFLLEMDLLMADKDVLGNTEVKDIYAALKHLDPDSGHDDRVAIGMCLKTSLGDNAFDIYNDWCSKGKKYEGKEKIAAEWKYFKSEEGGRTLGTLFFLACQHGYTPPPNKVKIADFVDIKGAKSLFEKWRNEGLPFGVRPTLGRLEGMLDFVPGGFTVITGYPGNGKSEFVDSLVLDLAKQNQKSLYFSMENPWQVHLRKLTHKLTGKRFQDRTPEEDSKALDYLADHITIIGKKFGITVSNVDKFVAVAKKLGELNFVIIDPFNYIDSEGSGGAAYDHVMKVCDSCIKIAGKHDVHVILVAHPKNYTRDKDGKRPVIDIDSIAGGSGFAAKADNVVVVDRNPNIDGMCMVRVIKVRDQDVAQLGSVNFKYSKDTKEHTPS